MLQLLRNLFVGSRGFAGFGRRPSAVSQHKRGVALGTIASIAAPFVIRKLMGRRSQRQAAY
jgi:hypothetical protein